MKEIIITLVLIWVTVSKSISQVCDCDILPWKPECKNECGIKELQNGSIKSIEKNLKVNPETAKRIVRLPNRKNISKVEDLSENLPCKYYTDIENSFNQISINSQSQINSSGDNVIGNKVITEMIHPIFNIDNSSTITTKQEGLKRTYRDQISKFYEEGRILQNRLANDSLDTKLTSDLIYWLETVSAYLEKIEKSYSTKFMQPSISAFDGAMQYSIKQQGNHDYFVGTKVRNEVLLQIIDALK